MACFLLKGFRCQVSGVSIFAGREFKVLRFRAQDDIDQMPDISAPKLGSQEAGMLGGWEVEKLRRALHEFPQYLSALSFELFSFLL